MRFLVILLVLYTSTAYPLFWVSNRYTTPFWSGDTRITSGQITTFDAYLGYGTFNDGALSFNNVDFNLCFYQTIARGVFVELSLPMTALHIMKEISPTIHQTGGLCYENASLLLGWGINYDRIPFFDFIDCMIHTGCITPAHEPLKYAAQESFYGYTHWGIPIALDCALGMCGWITGGLHASVCFFDKPTVYHIEPYFKADHCVYGFSFWFGYSYTGATDDADSTILFPNTQHWQMHTLHYGIEYEFIQAEFPLHPRVGFYYNQPIAGTDALKRPNFGFTAGLDYTW